MCSYPQGKKGLLSFTSRIWKQLEASCLNSCCHLLEEFGFFQFCSNYSGFEVIVRCCPSSPLLNFTFFPPGSQLSILHVLSIYRLFFEYHYYLENPDWNERRYTNIKTTQPLITKYSKPCVLAGWLYVNLTQHCQKIVIWNKVAARVIWEEVTRTEKMLPKDWPVGKSMGYYLD